MAPVLYDEDDIAEMLDRQQRDLARKHRKETRVQLDTLEEGIKSNKAVQVGGAAMGGLALEGLAQLTEWSDPWDAVVSGGVGVLAFVGAATVPHDGVASGLLGGANAAVGRALASGLRWGVGAYRSGR